MAPKRQKATEVRVTEEDDCIVLWDDKTDNIVYMKEIENVETGKPINIGSRIKMFYQRKWYFGTVIEIVKKTQDTVVENPQSNLKKTIKESDELSSQHQIRADNNNNEENLTIKTKEDSIHKHETAIIKDATQIHDSSEKTTSSSGTFSQADDTDMDPNYEQGCETVGCGEEVFSACHNCLSLLCYDHFLVCGQLDCEKGHAPKKSRENGTNKVISKPTSHTNKEVNIPWESQLQECYNTDLLEPFNHFAVEDVNESTRTVGCQTIPMLTLSKATQTKDDNLELEGRENMMQHTAEHRGQIGSIELKNHQKVREYGGKKKKHFCIFCKELVLNFGRHIQIRHGNEEEVVKINSLPKGSRERLKLLDEIRGRGTLFFNTSAEVNKGSFIVKRNKGPALVGYTACPKCKNFYKKSSLHKHFKLCTGLKKAPRTLQSSSLSTAMAKEACDMDAWLKDEVLPGLTNKGGIRTVIMDDPLLIEYGNYLCVRHRTNRHLTNMVRNKLRQMAKLLTSMRDLDIEITTLESAYKPSKYDVFMKAVDVVAGYDPTCSTYRAPSLVMHLGASAQECAHILQTKSIKLDDAELQSRVVNWLKLYKHVFYYGVGKSALSKVAEQKWNKPRLVPVANDIIKLSNSIKSSIEKSRKHLEDKFDSIEFNSLNRALMLQIIIFNRKRIGEVEMLLVSDFMRRHNIEKDSEIYKTLSPNEKIVASRYMRMEVRGKLGRPVSILISNSQVELIKLILKLRNQANVSESNPYVFGRGDRTFFKAPPALRSFAYGCGATRPDRLTGTQLRKHMATISQAMDLTENDLSILADFMGHNITTHRNFYRMPNEVTHLARISQVLMSLEEGDVSKYAGKRLEDINVDVPVDEGEEGENQGEEDKPEEHNEEGDGGDLQITPITNVKLERNPRPITSRGKRIQKRPTEQSTNITSEKPKMKKVNETTPKKRISRKNTWKTPERHIARSVFSENIKTGRLPSINDCLFVLRQYRELDGRTVDQLKAWVYNEINRNKKF